MLYLLFFICYALYAILYLLCFIHYFYLLCFICYALSAMLYLFCFICYALSDMLFLLCLICYSLSAMIYLLCFIFYALSAMHYQDFNYFTTHGQTHEQTEKHHHFFRCSSQLKICQNYIGESVPRFTSFLKTKKNFFILKKEDCVVHKTPYSLVLRKTKIVSIQSTLSLLTSIKFSTLAIILLLTFSSIVVKLLFFL